MTIEPQSSWQIDYGAETQEAMVDHLDEIRHLVDHGVLVPDTRPQEIADAWAATKRQTITLRPDLPATEAEDGLFDLLDAFVEEGNDMILQIAEDVVLGPPLPPELTNLLDALPRRNDE